MYDRALIDRTLLAIAAASTAPRPPGVPSPWTALRAWWRGRSADAAVPATTREASSG